MIPEIGFMVGAYIITRMLSFILRTGERKEHGIVIVLAGGTILVTLFVLFSLLTRWSDVPGF